MLKSHAESKARVLSDRAHFSTLLLAPSSALPRGSFTAATRSGLIDSFARRPKTNKEQRWYKEQVAKPQFVKRLHYSYDTIQQCDLNVSGDDAVYFIKQASHFTI
jgi:hypothetical protein